MLSSWRWIILDYCLTVLVDKLENNLINQKPPILGNPVDWDRLAMIDEINRKWRMSMNYGIDINESHQEYLDMIMLRVEKEMSS